MRGGFLVGALVALLLVLQGCGTETPPANADGAVRLVSLAPHLTELVYTAGAQAKLVGVVSYSDFPEAARRLPKVGDAFRLDAERLASLNPTTILAWGGGNPTSVIEQLKADGYRVEVFTTESLQSIGENLRRIGALAGTSVIANAAADQFDQRLNDLRTRYADADPISVFFQISEQPVFTVSDRHAIGQIIKLCGGRNVFASLQGLAASVSDESVVASDPQVMFATGDVTALQRWQRYAGRATRNGHLYAAGADTITRDSTRLLDGATELCETLATVRAGRN